MTQEGGKGAPVTAPLGTCSPHKFKFKFESLH
jgi:hypothetical protein